MSDSRPSMFSMGSSQRTNVSLQARRSRKGAGDRSRRSWSDREEENLLLNMKDLVVNGWKSDNGFRSGYLGKLEEALHRQFPNCGIKGTPRITSKITAWKKSYNALQSIMQRSGVGFNLYGDFKIDCDDNQWSQIVRVDSSAHFMRFKPWPYFDDWKMIFGKDRANGTGAADFMDAVNELHSQGNEEGVGTRGGVNVGLDELSNTELNTNTQADAAYDSTCQSAGGTAAPSGSGIKRKADLGIEGLIDMLGKLQDDTNERLQGLSLRIGYEYDLSKARKQVYELLGRLPGLTRRQKFDAGVIILEKVERLDFFTGMPDEDRLAFVHHVLEKYGD